MGTGRELSVRRDHLADNRRMLIGRSVAAAVAGAIPLPGVDDWITSAIQRRTIRRIADSRHIDMNTDAVRALADGPEKPPEWAEIAGGALLVRMVTRAWKKVLLAYVAAKRTQAAARNFTIATLFDHYCARLHVGMDIDRVTAAELREIMREAMDETPGGLGSRLFRRGMLAAGRATVRAPFELFDIASGGVIRKLLKRGNDVEAEAEAVDEMDTVIERQLAAETSFLARSTKAIELQLSTDVNPYLDRVVAKFEELWRARREALAEGEE